MKEKLESALKNTICEAVSDVSYEEGYRYFAGNVKFVVNDGWTSVELISLNITE